MIILKNCRIHSLESPQPKWGDILIKDGKIAKIDAGISQSGARTIDVQNNPVLPGFIDGHSHIGLVENGMGFEGNDLNEVADPVTPHLRAIDGLNFLDRSFREGLEAGVTTAAVSPGKANVIGGQTCIVKMGGNNPRPMMVKNLAALNVNLGDAPKRANFGKVEMPMSRMAEAYLLRKALQEAQNYLKNGVDHDGAVAFAAFNPKHEALKPVLSREAPLRVAAHKLQDILTAISVADEFDLRLILDYCTEGHLSAGEIVNRKIPVMLGPYLTDSSSPELLRRDSGAAAVFSRAGALVSLITDHPDVPVQFLPACAGIAVREGMAYDEALKAITINPAKALGIDHRVGSIREGKDADLIVMDGEALKIKTRVLMTIIDGEILYEA